MAECGIKLELDQTVLNFKKMMQKFVYCIWNKFCTEDEDEIINHATYILNSFQWELDPKTIEAMIQQKEEENKNPSENDPSVESLEYELNTEGRATINSRFGYRKLRSSLEPIISLSQIDEDFSDCTWVMEDYYERFDKN